MTAGAHLSFSRGRIGRRVCLALLGVLLAASSVGCTKTVIVQQQSPSATLASPTPPPCEEFAQRTLEQVQLARARQTSFLYWNRLWEDARQLHPECGLELEKVIGWFDSGHNDPYPF